MNSLLRYSRGPRGYGEDLTFSEYRNKLLKKDRVLDITLKTSFAVLVLVFIAYLWFLFSFYPKDSATWVKLEKSKNRDGILPIASDLIDLASRQNFTSHAEKSAFLESELNRRFEEHFKKFNFSSLDTRFHDFNVSSEYERELNSLFAQFTRGYNEFLDQRQEVSAFNEQMVEESNKHQALTNELAKEKQQLLGLIEKEEALAKSKKELDDLIDSFGEISERKNLIKQKEQEITTLKCEEAVQKMKDFQRRQRELEIQIQNSQVNIGVIDFKKLEILENIKKLQHQLQINKGLLNISNTDYSSVKSLHKLLKFTTELERDVILTKPVVEALDILREKFRLLSESNKLTQSEYEKARTIYLYSVTYLREQVRELVINKKKIEQERRNIDRDLSSRESLESLEAKRIKIAREIEENEKHLKELQESYDNHEIERNKNENDSKEHEKSREKLEQENAEAEKRLSLNCTMVLKELELIQKEFERKKEILERALSGLNSSIELLQENSKKQSKEFETVKEKILERQSVFNNILKSLCNDSHELNDKRAQYFEKNSATKKAYENLLICKKNIIGLLSQIGEQKISAEL